MTSTLAEGDRVRVTDRDVTAADIKSQLFFDHYRGVVGKIRKTYADNTATIIVELEDLTTSQSAAHKDVTDWVRNRELERLSEEAKNKLAASDKKFGVPYAILVSINDLTPASDDERSGKAAGLPDAVARKSLTQLEEEEARHMDSLKRSQP